MPDTTVRLGPFRRPEPIDVFLARHADSSLYLRSFLARGGILDQADLEGPAQSRLEALRQYNTASNASGKAPTIILRAAPLPDLAQRDAGRRPGQQFKRNFPGLAPLHRDDKLMPARGFPAALNSAYRAVEMAIGAAVPAAGDGRSCESNPTRTATIGRIQRHVGKATGRVSLLKRGRTDPGE
jgi:hypothetical protein